MIAMLEMLNLKCRHVSFYFSFLFVNLFDCLAYSWEVHLMGGSGWVTWHHALIIWRSVSSLHNHSMPKCTELLPCEWANCSFEFGTWAVVFYLDLRPEDFACIHISFMHSWMHNVAVCVIREDFVTEKTTTTSCINDKCLWKINKWVLIYAVFFYFYCHFWVGPALYSSCNSSLYTAGTNRNHTVKA